MRAMLSHCSSLKVCPWQLAHGAADHANTSVTSHRIAIMQSGAPPAQRTPGTAEQLCNLWLCWPCTHCCGCLRAGYSLWSNRSFKAPVVAGAVACLAGNVLYCLSYDARALWMLMLSRFVMGFGAHTAALGCRFRV